MKKSQDPSLIVLAGYTQKDSVRVQPIDQRQPASLFLLHLSQMVTSNYNMSFPIWGTDFLASFILYQSTAM
jgi:predicted acyltransferase